MYFLGLKGQEARTGANAVNISELLNPEKIGNFKN